MPNLIARDNFITARGWEELENMAKSGLLRVGNQIELEFDGKPVLHDVIGINADIPAAGRLTGCTYVTIQHHDLLEERPFDTKDEWGSNVWETSEIREYLNSSEFLSRYADISGHVVEVVKKNNSGEPTKDVAFLPSLDEYDPGKTIYPYYKDRRNRVKFNENSHSDWYWLRSAYRGTATYTWHVVSTGSVYSNGYAGNAYRFAPGLCLIF